MPHAALRAAIILAVAIVGAPASAQVTQIDGTLIASEHDETCIIADMRDPAQLNSTTVYPRAVACWGLKDFHGIKSPDSDPRNIQRALVRRTSSTGPVLTDVSNVALGVGYGCAAVGGKIACWGRNDERELGRRTTYFDGTYTTDNEYNPTFVTLSTSKQVTQLTTGDWHTCALMTDTTVMCWGFDGYGNVGDGESNQVTGRTVDEARETDSSATGENPKTVLTTGTTPLTNVRSIAAGTDHTCAVLYDGTVRCWGLNSVGQLGVGTLTSVPYRPDIKVAGPSSCLEPDFDVDDPDEDPPDQSDYSPCSPRPITVPVTVGSMTALNNAVLVGAFADETCVGVDTTADGLADRLTCWGGSTLSGRQTIDLATLRGQYGPIARFWMRRGTPTASGRHCFQFSNGVAGCASTAMLNGNPLTMTATGLDVYGTGIVGFAADDNLCDVGGAVGQSLVYRCRGDNREGAIQPQYKLSSFGQLSVTGTLWEYWTPFTTVTVSANGTVVPAAAPATSLGLYGFGFPVESTYDKWNVEGQSTHLWASGGRSGKALILSADFGTPGVDLQWRSKEIGVPDGKRYRVGVWAMVWDGGGPVSLSTEFTNDPQRQTVLLDPNAPYEEWQYLELLTPTVPYGRSLLVELKLAGDGIIFFDDLSITAEDDPTTNWAPDSGFELTPYSWIIPTGASASHTTPNVSAHLYRPNPGSPSDVISWSSKANAFPITNPRPSRGYQVMVVGCFDDLNGGGSGSFLVGYRKADDTIIMNTVRASLPVPGAPPCYQTAALPAPPPDAAKIWSRVDVTGKGRYDANNMYIVPFP